MSRHILARIALVKGAVDRGEIVIKGIPGTENPADLLTKVCFKSGVFQYLLKRMGLWICEMYYRTEWPRLKAPDKLLSRLPTGTKIAYVQLQRWLPLVSPTLPLMLVVQVLWVDTMLWLALWLVSPVGRARVDVHLSCGQIHTDTMPFLPRTLILHQNHAPQFSLLQTWTTARGMLSQASQGASWIADGERGSTTRRDPLMRRSGPLIRPRGERPDDGIDTDYGIMTSLQASLLSFQGA